MGMATEGYFYGSVEDNGKTDHDRVGEHHPGKSSEINEG
jgi:hypothetical protein